jgi:hypothetical protein
LTWFEPEGFGACGVRAAFSARAGGASPAPFDSLNLGLHVGDADAAAVENRRRLWSALELDPAAPAGAQQVHGARVALAGPGDRGRGARAWSAAFAAADGLVTAERGVPLFVLGADCALVALAAPDGAGCAAIHAGWRGLAAGIVESGARQLCQAARCSPGELRAFLGAMLGEECYEVQEDLAASLAAAWGRAEAEGLVSRDSSGRLRFRYGEAVLRRLDSAGVARQNVEQVGHCTACRQDLFFSHRASGGRTGRMAMTVWVP